MLNLLAALALAASLLQQAPQPAPPPAPQQATAPATRPAEAAKEDPAITALALKIYTQMRAGKVDESLMTEQMNKGLSPAALAQSKPMFDQLGDPTKLTFISREIIPEGIRYQYLAVFATAQLHVRIFVDNQGKVAGYFLAP